MTFTEKIIKIIKENIEKAKDITPETNIWNDLEIDSLDFMIVINAIEDEYNVSIEETEFTGIQKVSELIIKLKQSYPGIEEK